MENGGVDGGLGVFDVGVAAKGPVVVVEIQDHRRVGVIVGGGECVECADERRVGAEGVGSGSAPHRALGEGFEGEARHDAEVVAAAAEGEVEVWV